MVIKSPKRENIDWDATSRDKKYWGDKICRSVFTLGHTDQRGSYSRVEITGNILFWGRIVMLLWEWWGWWMGGGWIFERRNPQRTR
jgi:hypothetical protein